MEVQSELFQKKKRSSRKKMVGHQDLFLSDFSRTCLISNASPNRESHIRGMSGSRHSLCNASDNQDGNCDATEVHFDLRLLGTSCSGSDFFLEFEDLGRTFENSFPACAFFF